MNSFEAKKEAFGRMLTIMDELRAQCPWDKKQTLESLRHLTIEEMYELGDAILDKNMTGIKKELGDVLLHIVFYAKIASETGDFVAGGLAPGEYRVEIKMAGFKVAERKGITLISADRLSLASA